MSIGIIKKIINIIKISDVTALSAQLAYFSFLSVFPFLICIISLLSMIYKDVMVIPYQIIANLPIEIKNIINETVVSTANKGGVTVFSFSFLSAIWISSGGISAIIKGINKIYDIIDNRVFFIKKLIALGFTLLFTLIGVGSLLLLTAGKTVFDKTNNVLNLNIVWLIILLIILFFMFLMVFLVIPSKKVGLLEAFPGAIFSSVVYLIISQLLSIYFRKMNQITMIYGSLVGAAILLIWLYVIGIILLTGASINYALSNDTLYH